MLNLHDKLNKLSRIDDMVVFQWTAGHKRIAQDFVLLSQVRLNVLSCNAGKIVYSTSAPIVYNYHGRPAITFHDRGLMTVIAGSSRAGVNIPTRMLKQGEEGAPTRYCEWRIVDEDFCPKWLENKIMSMCTGVLYPAFSVKLPDVYRVSKKPETLRPIFTSKVIASIGGNPTDSTEELLSKFRAHLDLFGFKSNEGFVIPNEYICTGGCCVVRAKGIPAGTGSVTFSMPLKTFVAECDRMHWAIATAITIPEEKK